MDTKELAKMAAKNQKNIPSLVEGIVESLENVNSRFAAIEKAILELSSKITKLDKIPGDISSLKSQVSNLETEMKVLTVWKGVENQEEVVILEECSSGK